MSVTWTMFPFFVFKHYYRVVWFLFRSILVTEGPCPGLVFCEIMDNQRQNTKAWVGVPASTRSGLLLLFVNIELIFNSIMSSLKSLVEHPGWVESIPGARTSDRWSLISPFFCTLKTLCDFFQGCLLISGWELPLITRGCPDSFNWKSMARIISQFLLYANKALKAQP